MKRNPKFSIVIPTYNAAASLEKCLNAIQLTQQDVEIIVVDGGSCDNTVDIALKRNLKLYYSEKGRGVQLNVGAKVATGDIFLFLHADTLIPKETFDFLEEIFQVKQLECGTFTLRFNANHWLLDLYGRLTRIDSLWTRFGDQCIVVRKNFFDRLHGFRNWPLFEDVRFLQDARKITKIYSFPLKVTTSAEKFLKNGLLKQQIKNGWLILQYLLGVSPEILSRRYR